MSYRPLFSKLASHTYTLMLMLNSLYFIFTHIQQFTAHIHLFGVNMAPLVVYVDSKVVYIRALCVTLRALCLAVSGKVVIGSLFVV